MSSAEFSAETASSLFTSEDAMRCRESVIAEMQVIAPPGLEELDPITTERLRLLTQELVIVDGERAGEEYDRYNGTGERGLDLCERQLGEWLRDKTILVTGGTGLIGSALLGELSQYGPARLASVSRGEMEPVRLTDAEYYRADIRDDAALRAVMDEVKPDIVFHVAADKYNHEAERRIRHTLTTNIIGTQNVVAAANEAGVEQLIYASTGKATRPFSPDIYASSKKTGEWLLSDAARTTEMNCSAVRFTHVVDHSNVRYQIHQAMAEGRPINIQSPDVMMYVQSARESAQLLMNSGLEAHLRGDGNMLQVQAIRELGMPINLPDLAIGALARHGGDSPMYFTGVRPGYEDKAWFALYDPLTGGEVSPLINSLEASDAEPSLTCEAVDTFPLEVATTPGLRQCITELQTACAMGGESSGLRSLNQQLGWAMLGGRLAALDLPVLARAAQRIERQRQRGVAMSEEHERLNDIVLESFRLAKS